MIELPCEDSLDSMVLKIDLQMAPWSRSSDMPSKNAKLVAGSHDCASLAQLKGAVNMCSEVRVCTRAFCGNTAKLSWKHNLVGIREPPPLNGHP